MALSTAALWQPSGSLMCPMMAGRRAGFRANSATRCVTPGQQVTSKALSSRTVVRGQWDDELKVLAEAQDQQRRARSSD